MNDLFRSIASKLQVSDYRFSDRFLLQLDDHVLHGSENIQSCGIRSGSRLLLAPKLTTGLRGSPATRREVKKAIETLVDNAMQNGELNGEPVTLVAQVGDQHIAVQISPVGAKQPKKTAEVAPPAPEPAVVEQLVRKAIAEEEDRFKEQERKRREHERESAVCLVSLCPRPSPAV